MAEYETTIGAVREIKIVRDEQKRGVLLAANIDDELHNRFARAFVEISRRFIRENQRRAIDERTRDGDALAFAAGKLGRQVRHAFGEPDAGEQFLRLFPRLAHRRSRDACGEQNVFERGQLGNEVEKLKDIADKFRARLGEKCVPALGDAFAGPEKFAGIGRVESAENLQERRFPRTAFAAYGNAFSGCDGEIDVGQHVNRSRRSREGFFDILSRKDVFHFLGTTNKHEWTRIIREQNVPTRVLIFEN